jgi:hypothetical protein
MAPSSGASLRDVALEARPHVAGVHVVAEGEVRRHVLAYADLARPARLGHCLERR